MPGIGIHDISPATVKIDPPGGSREMCGWWIVDDGPQTDECRHLNVARLEDACPNLPGGCGIDAHWSVKG
jgi:hypothetical protein